MVAVLLLLAASFPKFTIIAMAAIGVSLLSFCAMAIQRPRIDKIGIWLIVLLLITLFSGLVSNGISFSDLADISLYDGEGRIFIAYIPFLPFLVCHELRVDTRLILKLIYYISLLTIFLSLIWIGVKIPFFTHGGRFYGFFTHHTGGATLCIIFMVVLYSYGKSTNNPFYKYAAFGLMLPIMLIGSRQALVALVATLAIQSAKAGPVKLIAIGLTLFMGFMLLPVVAPNTWARVAEIFAEDTQRNIQSQLNNLTWDPSQPMAHHIVGNQWNILSRIVLYGYSIQNITYSPIIGIGFGRINDGALSYEGVRYFAFLATDGVKMFNTLSSHNSLLNILAEGGVVTLTVWVILWRMILVRLAKARKLFLSRSYYIDAALTTGGQAAFIAITVGSLFDHAFVSPTFVIPTLVLIGCSITNYRALLTKTTSKS